MKPNSSLINESKSSQTELHPDLGSQVPRLWQRPLYTTLGQGRGQPSPQQRQLYHFIERRYVSQAPRVV